MKLSSAFLYIFKKAKLNKSYGVHENGEDNLYPEAIENIIKESVTAFRCSKLMSAYTIGKGFGKELNRMIINEAKQVSLFSFGNDIAESLADHKGVYIQFNYNVEGKKMSAEVLPFTDCRLGKKDDNSYSGKIHVCDDWTDSKKAKKATKVDVYNPDPKVIQSQIVTAGSIEKYKGQILYYKFGKMTYPLSPLHPARLDADSEKQASVYKNKSLRKGFFGKTMVVTKPLVDDDLKNGSDEDVIKHKDQVSERDSFRSTLQKFVGAENVDGIMHVEMEFDDKLEDEIMFKNIDSNINDKLFAFTENSVRNNIRISFNNVPAALIESADGKLFGSSGEAIYEMKLFYQDQTEIERISTEEIVNTSLKNWKSEKEIPIVEIIPLIKEREEVVATTGGEGDEGGGSAPLTDAAEEVKKQAQANLKGSVGGVTALLTIQQSVKAGTTDRESALTIIEEIFGIERELAGKMLGEIKEGTEGDPPIKTEE